MPARRNFWEELFAASAGAGGEVRIQMRAVSKGGRPFLLVPCQPRAAAVSLSLYPAQTPRARLARTLLVWLMKAGMPLGAARISFTLSPGDAFARFLSSLAGVPLPGLPTFGILAGNPASDGQRFLLLVFDAGQMPVAVVKAGVSERAKSLIEKEQRFLTALPPDTSCIPRLRSSFQSPGLRAFALDFFAGDSPKARDTATLPALLASWVNPQRTLALSATPDWARLERAASANELFAPLVPQLRGRSIHPAIQHGDFAPWNIKVSPTGAWMVLDWERGELAGIPAWDWFHYVVQPAILVEHLPALRLVQRVETVLGSEVFKAYAARAGIRGFERELCLAYLLHQVEVIKPSEGLAAARDLLRTLAVRWLQV